MKFLVILSANSTHITVKDVSLEQKSTGSKQTTETPSLPKFKSVISDTDDCIIYHKPSDDHNMVQLSHVMDSTLTIE